MTFYLCKKRVYRIGIKILPRESTEINSLGDEILRSDIKTCLSLSLLIDYITRYIFPGVYFGVSTDFLLLVSIIQTPCDTQCTPS